MKKHVTKDVRLTARTSEENHDLVNQAAALVGNTVTQFLLNTVLEKAKQVIEEHKRITLNSQQAETLFHFFDNPPPLNNNIKTVAKRHKALINELNLTTSQQGA